MMEHKVSRFWTILLAVTLTVSLLNAAPVPNANAQVAAIRIMPLGDSITGSPGCWRALLWNRLLNSGFTNIDFVGTLPLQGCGIAYDGDNEGHGGILATNMANQNQLPPWLAATNPDIVIMHLGTNDVWSAIAPATILAAFSTLVDQMRANNPNVKVLVAQIIPLNPSSCPACAQRAIDFNAAIPAWASGKSTTQSPIIVVDQWTGFSTSTDTTDGVHPNDAGNQKISDRWYPALAALLTGGPTSTPTRTPTGPTPTATRTGTPTRTPTITPTASGALKVQLVGAGTDNGQQTAFHYRIQNTGQSARSNLSVRLYFTTEGSNAASSYVLEKYYDQSGAATVSGPTQAFGSTYYFTVSYGTASLPAGGAWEYHTSLHLNTWGSTYSAANDWWHASGTLPASYTDWVTLPAYVSGNLAWGSEPPVGPTNTPTLTPTATGTTTALPPVIVEGHVWVGSASGPGLPGVVITTWFGGPHGQVTTDADGYYQVIFPRPLNQETVSLTPQLAGYTFSPGSYSWIMYSRDAGPFTRDFVAAAGSLPDLVPYSFSFYSYLLPPRTPPAQGCYLPGPYYGLGMQVTVRNLGTADAGSFFVDMNGQQQITVSSLAAGASAVVQFPRFSNPSNTVTVDATGLVAESDESNNAVTWQVPAMTPTRTGTPPPTVCVITNTPTPITPTLTPTFGPTTLRVQYRAADTNAGDNQIKPHFNIVNAGTSPVPLSELKIRYWFTREGTANQNFWCDWAAIPGSCSNVSGTFVPVSPARTGADFYVELSFAPSAGSISAGGQSGEIQLRLSKSDWSNYNETGDYSFDPTRTSFADWTHVTLYRNGVLVWGTEP